MHAFPRRLCVFSRGLGCRARRGAACTPRRKTGSRAGSATRALSVQSREIWQVITGSFSAELRRAEQDNGKPACQLFCSFAVKDSNTIATIASSFPRCYSYGHCYACVGHYHTCVVMMYACLRCVCSVHLFACVRVCPCVRMLALGCYVLGRTRTCKHLFVFKIYT